MMDHGLQPSNEPHVLLKILVMGLFAAMGGAVKYISTVLRMHEKVSNRRFIANIIANMIISSFCGLMGALFALTISNSWAVHSLAAGGIGYLGTQGLDLVLLAMRRKIDPSTPVSSVLPIPSDPSAP